MEGYFGTNEYGYLKITELGDKRAKQLAARTQRLGAASYDEFEAELGKVGQAIETRYQRFIR
jgi:hypothetical protein